MSKPEFVYTTYIETTPEKLWDALTDGDFTERYWFGHRVASDWKIGSPYKFVKAGREQPSRARCSNSIRRSGSSYTWDYHKPDDEARAQFTRHLRPRAARQGRQADRDA